MLNPKIRYQKKSLPAFVQMACSKILYGAGTRESNWTCYHQPLARQFCSSRLDKNQLSGLTKIVIFNSKPFHLSATRNLLGCWLHIRGHTGIKGKNKIAQKLFRSG